MAAMHILITGASGLIGSHLVRALTARGHRVIAAGRRPAEPGSTACSLSVDFAQAPGRNWWAPRLTAVDAVVNAVGIFEEHGTQTFEALHERAPISLFEGAADAGVPLVVQISALGSDAQAETAFHRSKRAADDVLRSLPLRSVIVQPSLVYAPLGSSARLFNQLATLPLAVVPSAGAAVQPVHLHDLVEALVHIIENPPAQPCTVAAVGPEPLPLADYLAALRHALGMRRRAWRVAVPGGWLLWAAAVAHRLGSSTINADAVRMLLRGNAADVSAFAALLGRVPRGVDQFFESGDEREAARERAQMQTLLALMRASLAFVWILTGIVSLGAYPVQDSLDLLADFGLRGPLATVALFSGGLIDLALGLAVLLAPARALVHVWRAQLAVVLGYTLLITARMPHWWLDPFGPISKNLPLLVGIGMLMVVSRRRS